MRQARTDRRSLRTRQLLTGAMLELMRERRYDTITVQQITERANVGRSTFYAHFTDKDDLLVDGVHRMLADLDSVTPGPAGANTRIYPTLLLIRHIGEQIDLYRVMSRGRGLTLAMAALHEELTEVFAERLAARVPPGDTPAVPPPLLAAMIVSMLVTGIRAWVEAGATTPAEEVDRMFHTAAGPALRAGLRPQPAVGPSIP